MKTEEKLKRWSANRLYFVCQCPDKGGIIYTNSAKRMQMQPRIEPPVSTPKVPPTSNNMSSYVLPRSSTNTGAELNWMMVSDVGGPSRSIRFCPAVWTRRVWLQGGMQKLKHSFLRRMNLSISTRVSMLVSKPPSTSVHTSTQVLRS